MTTPEIVIGNEFTARLRELIGGTLTAGEISVDQASDPDEDSMTGSERIPGIKDRLDILTAYVNMNPVSVGILTKQVLTEKLHERDTKAVEEEIRREKAKEAI